MKRGSLLVAGALFVGAVASAGCSSSTSTSTTSTPATSAPGTTAGKSTGTTAASSTGTTASGSSNGQTQSTMSLKDFEGFAVDMMGATQQQAQCLYEAAQNNPGLALMFQVNKNGANTPTLAQAQEILTGFNGCTGSQAATAKLLGPLLQLSLPQASAECMTGVLAQLSPNDFAALLAEQQSSISAEGMSQINQCVPATTTTAS